MDGSDVGKLFTQDGKDVWRLVSYCEYPTISFKNLETGQTVGGAIDSLNVRSFMELVPVKYPKGKD